MDLRNVLVASGDAGTRYWLRTVLEAGGAVVREAANGDDLRAYLMMGEPFDLVLADAGLPGPSILRVLAGARSRGDRTPIVLVAAQPEQGLYRAVAALDAVVVFDRVRDTTGLLTFCRRFRRVTDAQANRSSAVWPDSYATGLLAHAAARGASRRPRPADERVPL